MKTAIDQNTANYIDRVIQFIELTEGKEGLERLTSTEGMKEAMGKLNAGYESFVTKFLNAPKQAREILERKMCLDVWLEVNRRAENDKINQMLSEI
jgi:hypothetical protein